MPRAFLEMEMFMTILLKGGRIYLGRKFVTADVLLKDGSAFVFDESTADEVIDLSGKDILPGFADVHVHFREPGFSYKETIRTGAQAAVSGGYTCICPMPNIVPVPKDLESLKAELDPISKISFADIIPYGAITVKQDGRSELSDMEGLAPYVCAFSDDGRGVQTGALMRDAMQLAKSLDKRSVAHCEDESLLEPGGCIHAGPYAEASGLVGISSASEWRQVERDVNLCYETGCGYHVCHVSTKESVQIIREAKQSGVNVTCETAPHYLALTQDDLIEFCRNSEPADFGKFKLNPPLREEADRMAIVQGLADGTIDMIATDHAPHTTSEKKDVPITSAPSGIIGLATSLSLGITELVDKGYLTLRDLLTRMSTAPAKLYKLDAGYIAEGGPADLVIFNPKVKAVAGNYASKAENSPFTGWELTGRVEYTICDGKVVYRGS